MIKFLIQPSRNLAKRRLIARKIRQSPVASTETVTNTSISPLR